MMIGKIVNKKDVVRNALAKLCVCLIVIAYIVQMLSMFLPKTIVPAAAEEGVEKIYTFGDDQRLTYLKWKGTTQDVRANPKSKSEKSVKTAFEVVTTAFCLSRMSIAPPPEGAEAHYSRELTKREFSPIYYAYFSGNEYGVKGKKLWYSTQVAIWCMLGQISSVRAKGLAQTEALTYNGEHSDVLKAVKELLKDSEEKLVKPHTEGNEKIRILGVPNFKIDNEKNTVTITGLSTSVAGCKVSIKNGNAKNAKVSVSGKTIKITTDYDADTQLKFTLEATKPYIKYSGKVYYLGGNYQNVGYVGDSISKTVSAKKTVKHKAKLQKVGSITIKKHPCVDGVKSFVGLEGAVFSINSDSFEDGEEIEVVTDKDGVAKVDNLPYGTYEITEVQAPEGYSLDNEEGKTNSVSVELSDSNIDYVYECYNSEVPIGYLEIRKVDVDDVTKRLSGARLVCRSVSGDFEAVVPEHHSVEGIYSLKLPYGDYILTEEKAPAGYVLDENNCEWYFTIDETSVASVVNIMIENSLPKGGVSIVKKDAQTGNPLEGAEFSLYCQKDIEINGVVRCKSGEVLSKQRTDEDGLVVFNDLYYGDYYIVENEAPSNYLLNENNKYEFSVGETNANVAIEVENKIASTPIPTPESTPVTTMSPEPTQTRAPIPVETLTPASIETVTPTPIVPTSTPTAHPGSTDGVKVQSEITPKTTPVLNVKQDEPKPTSQSTERRPLVDIPKTGDDTVFGVWVMATVAVFVVIIGMGLLEKK